MDTVVIYTHTSLRLLEGNCFLVLARRMVTKLDKTMTWTSWKLCSRHLFRICWASILTTIQRKEKMPKKTKKNNNSCLLFALISNVKFLCPAVDDWNLTIEIAGSTKPHFGLSPRWVGRGWVHQKRSVSPNLDCLLLISEIMDFFGHEFPLFPRKFQLHTISSCFFCLL